MTAEALLEPDPDDPAEILRSLPEAQRAQFLRAYAAALAAASDPTNYRALRTFLRHWRLHAHACAQPGFSDSMGWARDAALSGDWGETIALDVVWAG